MAIDLEDLDDLLGSSYTSGLPELGVAELRERRARCQDVELGLSYLRRLLQGRLDIVHAEMDSRAGGASSDVASLVEQLPKILGGRSEAHRSQDARPAEALGPGSGPAGQLRERPLGSLGPDDAEAIAASAGAGLAAGAEVMARLPEMGAAELEAISSELGSLERSVSAKRRRVHEVIDALQAELVRRYKAGEADVDSLLRPE
ncbi:MAG: RsiG family protein [Acidimicrobiales bacterium]